MVDLALEFANPETHFVLNVGESLLYEFLICIEHALGMFFCSCGFCKIRFILFHNLSLNRAVLLGRQD